MIYRTNNWNSNNYNSNFKLFANKNNLPRNKEISKKGCTQRKSSTKFINSKTRLTNKSSPTIIRLNLT